MNSEQFRVSDRVIIIEQVRGTQPGEVGVVMGRGIETLYAIRAEDGSFHWMDGAELETGDPERHHIRVGDTVRVTSTRRHPYFRMGELVQVVKIMEDTDYYKIFANDEFHWVPGFKLAKYM